MKEIIFPLTLRLNSCGNPDRGENPNRPLPGVPYLKYPVDSFEEASSDVTGYINTYNLGSGNFAGGQLFNKDGDLVAQVSYNGRVWPPGEWTVDTKPLWG